MNFRYLSLFMVLSICMPVSGAHFARRCAQFARNYPGPVAGVGGAFAYYSYLLDNQRKNIAAFLIEEKRQEKLGLINREVKQFIRDQCIWHGWIPDFIILHSQLGHNMAATSDGTKTGLIVGSGWGLGVQEDASCILSQKSNFLIGHESVHGRNNDVINKFKTQSLAVSLEGLLWHIVRASGKGKPFSLICVFVADFIFPIFLNSPLIKWQEFRADRMSAEHAPQNIQSGIEFLAVDAQEEVERLRTISAVMNGTATEFEKTEFGQALMMQFNRIVTHPPSIERIKRLEAMKNASSNKS